MRKIAILKPHHGPVGGFERVVARIENILVDAGYDVTRHTVDMTKAIPHGGNLDATDRELTNYRFGRDSFDGISTSVYDLVLSTSPPSYCHRHPAHLALFYHHHRVFYDLEDLFIDAGFAPRPDHHRRAAQTVRDLDAPRLTAVKTFLCPSNTVQNRLNRYNNRHDTLRFYAGIGVGGSDATLDSIAASNGALCVTRHEFPKRAELLVAAAHLLPLEIAVQCTGTGGRLAFAKKLDAELAAGLPLGDSHSLWCNTGATTSPATDTEGRVNFVGHVTDVELDGLYDAARCVVAPAYDEDYGLTAIEAMARARPVIVCRDGGGLAELIDDGETGLVVDPDPRAIADAIIRLHNDVALATELGNNGRQRAADLSWNAAASQLLDAVTCTLDTARD